MYNKNILCKIKRYIRKKYIIYRYKINFKTGKLIYLKNTDRGFGLTTLLLKDVLKYHIPILVPTLQTKREVLHKLYNIYQYNLNKILLPSTKKDIEENLVLTPTEDTRGRIIEEIFIDNSCTEQDVYMFINYSRITNIVNGFVTKRFD